MNMTFTKKIRYLALISLLAPGIGFSWTLPSLFTNTTKAPEGSNMWVQQEMKVLESQASNINQNVLRLSLIAYLNARKQGYNNNQILTVIDYSKPSTEKRLWIFDLQNGRELFNTWVAHGKNSGGLNATSFSDKPGSLKSSIGVFLTDEPYIGKNGLSLKIKGLEQGVNDTAYARSVVVHGAWYVNAANIQHATGIGRSWGCPAVTPSLAKPIINTIKDNSLIFAYYPDQKWLSSSRFLNA